MSSLEPVRKIAKTNLSPVDRTIHVKNDLDLLESLLTVKAKAFNCTGSQDEAKKVYLLSFHVDGVVWGKLCDKGELKTSTNFADSPSPKFRIETLQECRLFSADGEFLLWRSGETEFKAREILDEGKFLDDENERDGKTRFFDEPHVLWGREIEESGSVDFTVVREGQGVRHAFPASVAESAFHSARDESKRPRPLRLWVRHYLEYDDDGCMRIALSRLVSASFEEAE